LRFKTGCFINLNSLVHIFFLSKKRFNNDHQDQKQGQDIMKRETTGRFFQYSLIFVFLLITSTVYILTPAAGIADTPGTGASQYYNSLKSSTLTATEPVAVPFAGDSIIVPLCPAGTTFDQNLYPQNTLQSDPMVFTCTWNGTGRVYISGDPSSVTGIYADDGYTVTIQPSGAAFDAQDHRGVQHPVIELTKGMKPGSNTFTIVVQNWNGLSIWYGQYPPGSIQQTPYIVQVLDAPQAGSGADTESGPASANKSGAILVTKKINPVSVKQGTDAKITITVFNQGTAPVHDVEILDTPLAEFPVLNGEMQYSASLIEPNDSRIISYTVHATKPGSFQLNKTKVMYADQDGNYQIAYSGYERVVVLAPLIPPSPENEVDGFLDEFITWFNSLDRCLESMFADGTGIDVR
jgi:hypothetical protein